MHKIIHIDADCFFAAVEVRDNPLLRGRSVAVGGDPGRRGVIATCSDEARRHGVRSAMPSAVAKRLCPELQIVKPNMQKYKLVSQQMMAILGEYSEYIEPLSLDEAYLDVSGSQSCRGSATLLAKELKRRIRDEIGITISAGVAPVKFLAKIASDWLKPDGLFVVLPEQVQAFTAHLTVSRLPGVGPVTLAKLHRRGLYVCADIRDRGEASMVRDFGPFGEELYSRAWGEDRREVAVQWQRKSISVECTYAHDLLPAEMPGAIADLLVKLSPRLGQVVRPYRLKKAFVKVKFDDFRQTTMETAIVRVQQLDLLHRLDANPVGEQLFSPPLLGEFQRLTLAAWHREQRPVRLLGVGFGLEPLAALSEHPLQLSLCHNW